MSALSLAAAARAIPRRQIERPLRGNQREPPRTRCSIAALLPVSSARLVLGWLRSHDFGDEGFSRRRNRPFTSQVRKGPLDHLNRPFDKVDGCKLRERLHTPKTNWCSRPISDIRGAELIAAYVAGRTRTEAPEDGPAAEGTHWQAELWAIEARGTD